MGKVPPAIKRAGETLVADAKILNEVVGSKVGGSKALPLSSGVAARLPD
jgi:hypothetical protein